MKIEKIILASQSPRRKQLLEWAKIPFDIIIPDTAEGYDNSLSPFEIAEQIAEDKALAVKKKIIDADANVNGYTILAADTIVVLGNKIIGKPAGREDAINTLKKLSGKTHAVITGVCLLSEGHKKIFFDETLVEFHKLSQGQVEYYVDTYKPYDKAGAYAIQEWIGVIGIKSINGDFYNVMGLPVSRVVKELESFGYPDKLSRG